MKPHPIQPLEKDFRGTIRFKSNAIVLHLLDNGPFDMNSISCQKDFTQEDREQFAQLIGYSLSGFGELSYVRNETYETASQMAKEGQSENKARISYLEETLGAVRESLNRRMKLLKW